MVIGKVILFLIIVFFILAFAVRNIKTYFSVNKSIRGKSAKLTLSVALSSIIYILLLLRLTVFKPEWIFEVSLPWSEVLEPVGWFLIIDGFILGILALIAMRNSWRVGIKYDQKTELVTSGIYRISRNPYFLSYDILILGYLLLFPSILILSCYVALVFVFHNMILEEEKYLEGIHGEEYLMYKKKVGRYLVF